MAASARRAGLALTLCLGILASFPLDALARGGKSYSSGHSSYASGGSHRSSIKCESCPRDSHGWIQRDPKATAEFKKTHPKPPGCRDCQIDHIVTLSKGGRDDPSNMQWLPREEHQEKTKRDLRGASGK
jgi:hypothetical protein